MMSLFAALIGVAYPLILQAAQRIDDKYHCDTLTKYIIDKPSFVLFRILMLVAIPVAIITPFALYHFNGHVTYCYIILFTQAILTCAQLLNLYYINHVIQKATTSPEFLDMLISENKNNKRIREIFDFSKLYIIETNPDLIFKASDIVFRYIKDCANENSKTYNTILNSIRALLEEEDARRQTIYSKSPDLWAILLSPETKLGEELRYAWLWRFLQSTILANNTDHIIRYWSWADQCAGMSSVELEKGEDDIKKSNSFMHFNTMVGASLVYSDNWGVLKEILYYSHIYPPKYDLLPNTFIQLISEVRFVAAQDFGWLTKYSMRGMVGGVMMDDEIKGLAMRYLSLIYLRLQSVNNYNITYPNPMELPKVDMINNISECKRDLDNASWLLRGVQSWQQQPDIITQCLSPHFDYSESANDLLIQYIDNLKNRIDHLHSHPVVSQTKLQQFVNELKETINEDQLNLPFITKKSKSLELVYDKTRYEYVFPVQKTYLSEGTDWLYFYPESMVKRINNDVRWAYYSQCFLVRTPKKSYTIGYEQIVKAIEKLHLDSKYEVWVSGNYISNYANIDKPDANKLKYQNDNTWLCDQCEIHQFECKKDVVIVVKKGSMPVVYSKQFSKLTDRDMKELENQSHFYSNIENTVKNDYDESHYGINLGRIVEFYAPKDYEYILLKLSLPGTKKSDLNEIQSIENYLVN